MSWDDFWPYQRMMIYGLLLALRGYHKGIHKDVNWVQDGGMERWIEVAGLDGKLQVTTLLDMSPDEINHQIRIYRNWDDAVG